MAFFKVFSTISRTINCELLQIKRKEILYKNFYTSDNLLKRVSFNLSDIGEGIREVVVKEWFVKVGDKVAQFDNICEVQSDKASVTITSRYDGIVEKLHYKIDDIAFVGKPLVDLEIDNDDDDDNKDENNNKMQTIENKSDLSVEQTDISISKHKSDTILCVPSVRRLAKQYNIDLTQIKGTGKANRILKEDILKYLNDKETAQVPDKSNESTADRIEPIKGFQKAMVKTMTQSLKIPHLVYGDEISVTEIVQLRKRLQNEYPDKKLSLMPFFIKAVSNSLKQYPILNAIVDENCENLIHKNVHNIGIAMDTKIGLAVPVIKHVETLDIIQINDELLQLMKSGKEGNFTREQLADGTFTISNIGAVGGTYMKPVIMPPQSVLLAIGSIQKLPRFNDSNEIVPDNIINISLAADHRVIDGATVARFVRLFKKQLENPYLLFLNL